ncbi:GTP-binding protein [Heyndrickxia ginsengihumi]|uniref:GTP-binding protein n=1 Tax=Heyndrickxia ginsengihumi TaxID=363870 RepID=A0A0A6VFY4_9BACI|nr:GTP-binding protein [Heyndrickxia ginsengihumi]KHD85539.1 GTP-binding protein [Heyndrickxia ginsengihumi]
MRQEERLVKKEFYESIISENETRHPIEVLGEMFAEESKQDVPELTSIRFAQGEVYYHYKDFEAAIMKWENVHNEMEPWAQKNIGDAYLELGFHSMAEEIYKAIATDSTVLNTEVSLQLISLYIEENNHEATVDMIKKTVQMNPDYPNVTKIARAYFEEHQDWMNAIELAVNEAIRTESLYWFEILKDYVEKNITTFISPSYFNEALATLYKVDQLYFEKLIVALWKSYQTEANYLQWVREFNELFINIEVQSFEKWRNLSEVYQETYFSFINGDYFIKDLTSLVPLLLTNWLKIAHDDHMLFAASSILSWNDLFPASIRTETIHAAESLLAKADKTMDQLEYLLALFDSIMKWAKSHQLEVSSKLQWFVRELIDFDTQHILVTGFDGRGKTTFVQSFLSDVLPNRLSNHIVVAKDDEKSELKVISNHKINTFAPSEDKVVTEEAIIEWKSPSPFLKEHSIALIDTPALNGPKRSAVFDALYLADTLLFMLDVNEPFSENEISALLQLKEQVPNTPFHFVLSKMDTIYSQQKAASLIEETENKMRVYFPNAKLSLFSANYSSKEKFDEFSKLTEQPNDEFTSLRAERLVYYVRESITYLLQQRLKIENDLVDAIHQNEDLLAKLNGAINQLGDVKNEQIYLIKNAYQTIIEKVRQKMLKNIPFQLQQSSDFITENSDFRKIHLELNEEMNKRVRHYIQSTILPDFYEKMSQWIEEAEGEFHQSQIYLNELAGSFNQIYGEEILNLSCDFQVIDDWRRDSDRFTNSVQLESVNILLRHTPSQVIMKSTNKLLGAFSQNKAMLSNRYKKFVETEDYREVAELITNKLLLPFELFEQSLERDINLFFKNPETVLNKAVTDTENIISENRENLEQMKENPELYQDPLKLFKLKLRQYEWMMMASDIREYA